jgi:hypothetical protein
VYWTGQLQVEKVGQRVYSSPIGTGLGGGCFKGPLAVIRWTGMAH